MKVKMLIADDDEQILSLLAEFAETCGYQADLAKNVTAALALLQKNKYDIILTDKNMPDDEGRIEAGMMLLEYATKNMPSAIAIMITGYATVETAVDAMKTGAFDYIMKPIAFDELKEKIDRALEYRRFINSEETLQTYRYLHHQVIKLIGESSSIPEGDLQQKLRGVGAKIDHVFGLQKEYETIIQSQADALEKIDGYIEHLKDAIAPDSPYFEVVERISEESKKRI
jgi:DNA-binding NtrC family response regulator